LGLVATSSCYQLGLRERIENVRASTNWLGLGPLPVQVRRHLDRRVSELLLDEFQRLTIPQEQRGIRVPQRVWAVMRWKLGSLEDLCEHAPNAHRAQRLPRFVVKMYSGIIFHP
jgi:hypothetical protein